MVIDVEVISFIYGHYNDLHGVCMYNNFSIPLTHGSQSNYES